MLKFRKPNFSRRWELAGELQAEPAEAHGSFSLAKQPQTLVRDYHGQIARIYFELGVTW
jgi:hypothetical protein